MLSDMNEEDSPNVRRFILASRNENSTRTNNCGVTCQQCVSFESISNPGQYMALWDPQMHYGNTDFDFLPFTPTETNDLQLVVSHPSVLGIAFRSYASFCLNEPVGSFDEDEKWCSLSTTTGNMFLRSIDNRGDWMFTDRWKGSTVHSSHFDQSGSNEKTWEIQIH